MAKSTESPKISEPRERDGINRTVNLNDILDARARAYILRTKDVVANYSMGDLLRQALREFLDREEQPHVPTTAKSAATVAPRRSPAELAAMIAGVQVGIPEPAGFVVVDEEKDDEQHRRDFVKEFGPAAPRFFKDRGFMRLPSWPKKFEAAREQQEREAGS